MPPGSPSCPSSQNPPPSDRSAALRADALAAMAAAESLSEAVVRLAAAYALRIVVVQLHAGPAGTPNSLYLARLLVPGDYPVHTGLLSSLSDYTLLQYSSQEHLA